MDTSTIAPLGAPLALCLAIARAHAALARHLDGQLGGFHGVSFADFTVLLALGQAPGGRLRRVDLAAGLGLTASAVTRTLIPLEKIGIVTRQNDPRDARVGYAALTAAGRRILAEATETAESLAADALRGVKAPDLRAMAKTLERIAAA